MEKDYLNYCLQQVEEQLNWKSSKFWKESDYIKLSEIISTSSHISISPHTLKRLFGKIKYKEQYNPQLATKNALSKFLGYKDWANFVEETDVKIADEKSEAKSRLDAKSKKKLILAISVCIFFILGYLLLKPTSEIHNNSYQLTFKDSIGFVPFTVPIAYDFSNVDSDSLWFDFGISHPLKGKQGFKIESPLSSYNFTYQIPGYYNLSFNSYDKNLSVKRILALSKNWDTYYTYELNMRRFWLDNQVKKQVDSSGFLYYTPEQLEESGLDRSKVFYVTNRLYKAFEIDGNNFELETRVKNTANTGGITCFDFILRISCEHHANSIRLMESGCSQFSGVKFGELVLNGDQNDLSKLTIDHKNWNIITIRVENKVVELSINGELVFNGEFKESNGNIVGIENMFKGTGMVDYIKIRDLGTDQNYFKDF